jgi:hypothetical protein
METSACMLLSPAVKQAENRACIRFDSEIKYLLRDFSQNGSAVRKAMKSEIAADGRCGHLGG